MEKALKDIEEISKRLHEDLEKFTNLMMELNESQYRCENGARIRLEDSLRGILSASTLLTSFVYLKTRLSRAFDKSGAFELASTKRELNLELTDIIHTVRTALSSLTERNRTLRDLYNADNVKEAKRGME